jgi:hypothetical protein
MSGYRMAVVAGVVFFAVHAARADPRACRELSDQKVFNSFIAIACHFFS